jgi:ketosteroid isomerase-like protein
MRAATVAVILIGSLVVAPVMEGGEDAVEEELLAVDSSFADTVAERDLEAFREMVAQDAVFFGRETLRGREDVVEGWGPMFDPDSGVTLRWRPHAAEAASSGDLGFTLGEYRLTQRSSGGQVETASGSYVTIWRRGPDGRWRAVVDIGTPPEPDSSAEPTVR